LPTFRRNLLLLSAGSENKARKQLGRKEAHSCSLKVKAVYSCKRLLTSIRIHGVTPQRSRLRGRRIELRRTSGVPLVSLNYEHCSSFRHLRIHAFNYCMNVLFACYTRWSIVNLCRVRNSIHTDMNHFCVAGRCHSLSPSHNIWLIITKRASVPQNYISRLLRRTY
jgi:hypothetical protein